MSLDAQALAAVFERIHAESMVGLPLLNPTLRVEVRGFQHWQGRPGAVVITPWMMSLLLLPSAQDDWAGKPLGHKVQLPFPGRVLRFLLNRIAGIDACLMHSIHSPMQAFASQEEARSAADDFLQALLAPPAEGAEESVAVDEELLGRILRGEEPCLTARATPPAPPRGCQSAAAQPIVGPTGCAERPPTARVGNA